MYKHNTIVPNIKSELSKKEQVTTMFNEIAPKYDFFNRFLSVGIDVIWRKKALLELKKNAPQIILDVATGTGDVAIMANKILKPIKIEGIDISKEMLEIGKTKVAKKGLSNVINLQIGDGEAISFNDNSFDAVTVAFGVRNFQNLESGLTEIRRVLKPNGKLMVLEFSKPKSTIWHKSYNLYMGIIAPKMVSIFSKNKKAYQYLNESAMAFPERNNFIEVLSKIGFVNCYFKELSLGICCIYIAEK